MKLLLLLVALLVGEFCLAQETSVAPKIKNETGPGRYNSGRYGSDRHNRRRDYDDEGYGKRRHYRTPIVDDYICDLESTILVVSSKHHVKEEKSYTKPQPAYGESKPSYGASQPSYGASQPSYGASQPSYGASQPTYGAQQPTYGAQQGYGGEQSGYEEKPKRREYATPDALRLKCSHIAVHSEHDCHTCCQLSARRYHSVSKNDIFGFIIDASEIKEDDKGYVRAKRDAGYASQPAASNYQQESYAPTYSTAAPYTQAPSYSAPAPSYTAPDYSVPSYPAAAPEYQEQPQAESEYAAAPKAYGGKSHGHYHGPPKNARCVCCSPKRHDNYDHHERRERNYKRRDYDRSDSDEY